MGDSRIIKYAHMTYSRVPCYFLDSSMEHNLINMQLGILYGPIATSDNNKKVDVFEYWLSGGQLYRLSYLWYFASPYAMLLTTAHVEIQVCWLPCLCVIIVMCSPDYDTVITLGSFHLILNLSFIFWEIFSFFVPVLTVEYPQFWKTNVLIQNLFCVLWL